MSVISHVLHNVRVKISLLQLASRGANKGANSRKLYNRSLLRSSELRKNSCIGSVHQILHQCQGVSEWNGGEINGNTD